MIRQIEHFPRFFTFIRRIFSYEQKRGRHWRLFWKVACDEPYRRVDLHYLTSSPAALETDSDFGGITGIEASRIARTDREIASRIARYLAGKLEATSALGAFLRGSGPEAELISYSQDLARAHA
jgi:hypothetical protein